MIPWAGGVIISHFYLYLLGSNMGIKATFIVLAIIALNMSVANASRDWSSFKATLKEKIDRIYNNEIYHDNDVWCYGGAWDYSHMWMVSTGAKVCGPCEIGCIRNLT